MENTRQKSGEKWLEKSKEENVLKKDFELPHVDKGVCDNFWDKKKRKKQSVILDR